ncbi:FecR domain-containing protein [Fulvivirgaceae bacterium BMA10]|uniref:FecR domain-containing protein n=1 Tax=Splendidivirga corallicola TaxID=3051826 RepID=A0ABT8KHF4_9BACT|nr:FecR domain-containing protein [Fulvivirgaceae bacterium BMA10]
MSDLKLRSLLEKYYNGETSREEDELLLKLLEREDLPKEFYPDRAQFDYFEVSKKEELPRKWEIDLEQNLFNAVKAGKRPVHWFLKAAAVLVILFGITILVYQYQNKEMVWNEITSSDQQKEVILPDGSKILLNENSVIRFPEHFEKHQREVFIVGEAFFDVAHKDDWPFMVHAQNTITEVLGTTFNIRSYAKENNIEVVVLSGKVAFSSLKSDLQEKVFLNPGNSANFDKLKNSISKFEKSDPNSIAWKTNRLVFQDDLLDNVIKILENHFHINIEVINKELLNCHFRGTFENEDIKHILEVMAFTMNVSYKQKNGNTFELTGNGCSENKN